MPGESSNASVKLVTPAIAATIGKYRIVAELGSGGMANVYLAVMRGNRGVNKLVVLKVPRDVILEDAGLLTMFLDEARLAARLNHRNVVQTYEVVAEGGRDIIVMEYLDGQTLNEILVRGRRAGTPLPLGMHLRVVIEALNGLHYAHEMKDFTGASLEIVHRDVSPHNIFITFDGQVKVLDFGVAKAAISSHVTQAGTFKGKVRYMPPEQLVGGSVDRRADIFAMGVVLWEAATGKKLWQGVGEPEVMTNVVSGKIPKPREVAPEVDERLEAIINKALAFRPADRYATCHALRADLESFVREMTPSYAIDDVAPFVTSLFADVRAQRNSIIEEQVSRANLEVTGEYQALSAGALPVPTATLSGHTPAPSSKTPSIANATAHIASEPPAKSRVTRIVAVVGLAGAVALGAFVMRKPSAPAAAPAQAVQAPTASTQPVTPTTTPPIPSPVRPGEASVTFEAKPREAKLFLDDEPLATNPLTKNFPKDGSAHTIRAEAKGYLTKTLGVHFDGDKEVVVTLDKVAARPAFAWQPSKPAPSSPSAPAEPSAKPAAPSTAAAAPSGKPAAPVLERPKRPDRPIEDKL